MPLANPPPKGTRTVAVVKTEEKSSDVNLATFLLLDVFKREADVAVVISNDFDLKLPIEVAQQELGLRVGVVNPHPPARRSRALRPTFFKQIRPSALAACVSSRPSSPMRRERFASLTAGSGNAEARRSGPRTQPAKWLGR
jgi:NYN domain